MPAIGPQTKMSPATKPIACISHGVGFRFILTKCHKNEATPDDIDHECAEYCNVDHLPGDSLHSAQVLCRKPRITEFSVAGDSGIHSRRRQWRGAALAQALATNRRGSRIR